MSTVSSDQPVVRIAHSLEATLALGRCIGQLSRGGQCIALEGELGTGKTQLVRGISLGAEVADITLVNSPSYVLLNIYEAATDNSAAKTVYHLDAYRVKGAGDFAAVGLPELLEQDGIVVIEWASRIAELLPADCLMICGEVLNESERCWRLTARGKQSSQLLKAIAEAT